MSPTEPKMVHFVCDNNKLFAELNELGELVEKVIVEVDYRSKVHPVVSVCERGKRIEQLNSPYGVTFDTKTGNIYVADQGSNCVKYLIILGRFCSNLEIEMGTER